jgi:hypothetical protein
MDSAHDAEMTTEMLSSAIRKADSHLHQIQDVLGCIVHAVDGNIGPVEDCLIDEEWGIRFLVLNTMDGLPGRLVLVSPQWISKVSWEDKKVFVNLLRAAVKTSPEFDQSKPVGPEKAGHHGMGDFQISCATWKRGLCCRYIQQLESNSHQTG